MRAKIAKSCVQLVNRVSKAAGRGAGTVIGGRVGLALDPQLLAKLSRGRQVVLVSGTNGKTTTTALVCAGLGRAAVTNNTGANMPAGHVAALSAASSQHDVAVLEVDEAWLPKVVSDVGPVVLVLLNLSRDQLDRVSEVRQIALKWRESFRSLPNSTVVIANADDPLVVWAAHTAPNVRWVATAHQWNLDAASCPECTSPLTFDAGSWSCRCGFARPEVTASLSDEGIVVGSSHYDLALQLPGSFNRVNAVLAVTALDELGVDPGDAVARLEKVTDVAGRFSERIWRSHRMRLSLAKNPAGFAALLATVTATDSFIAIGINDRVADGRDPSWLYDVPFELLRGKTVYCFGDRALDLATRLDLAGVSFVLDDTEWPTADDVLVIANYTAFRDVLEGSTAR